MLMFFISYIFFKPQEIKYYTTPSHPDHRVPDSHTHPGKICPLP